MPWVLPAQFIHVQMKGQMALECGKGPASPGIALPLKADDFSTNGLQPVAIAKVQRLTALVGH